MTRTTSYKKKRKRRASAGVDGDEDDVSRNQPLSSSTPPSPGAEDDFAEVPGADVHGTKTKDDAPLGVTSKSTSTATAEGRDGSEVPAETIVAAVDGVDDDHCADAGTTSEERMASEKGEDGGEKSKKRRKKKIRRLELTEVESFNAKLARRGVLYVARIPPAMGPARVRSLLSDFGEVTRIYLAPEDESVRKRRVRAGGHGAKRYVEGWAEFADRRVARRVGDGINSTPITNNKRSRHYGDLWSVKYLRKFTWDHLTEKVAYERRVREQKLAVEMFRARRENAEYAALVEEGKTMDKIEERRRKKAEKKKGSGGAAGGIDDGTRRKRSFRQTLPVEERKRSSSKAVLGSLV